MQVKGAEFMPSETSSEEKVSQAAVDSGLDIPLLPTDLTIIIQEHVFTANAVSHRFCAFTVDTLDEFVRRIV